MNSIEVEQVISAVPTEYRDVMRKLVVNYKPEGKETAPTTSSRKVKYRSAVDPEDLALEDRNSRQPRIPVAPRR